MNAHPPTTNGQLGLKRSLIRAISLFGDLIEVEAGVGSVRLGSTKLRVKGGSLTAAAFRRA